MYNLVERLRDLTRLPGSDVRITFSMPTPASSEPQPDIARLGIGKRDADLDGPIEYLSACRKEARALSRCTLPVSRRIQVTEDLAAHVVLIAARHIKAHSEDGGIPDSDRRKDLLETIAALYGYLIDSYKVAFRKLFGGILPTAQSIRELELSAFRILELSKLMQRVLGLRYEVLPGPAWLTVNTVFHAMRASGRADVKIRLLETGLLEDENAHRQTVANLYLAIQMVARFDILRWPTEMHQFLFAYCKSVNKLAEFVDDTQAPLPRYCSVAYCYDTRPARADHPDGMIQLGPSTLINWRTLIKKIRNDRSVFFGRAATKPDLSYFQKRLEKMTYNECLALIQLQYDSFVKERQQLPVDAGGGEACDMRIFIGFRSVYQLLQNIHMGKYGVGTRLDDVLAKRSAIFADDNVATVESVWYVQYEDKDFLRLKTQESKFTTSMRVGTMAAYGVGNDGIAKPRFGIITRIFRPSPQTVIVDVVKHGEFVEPAVVSQDAAALDSKDKPGVLGAIIVKSIDGEAKLLLPPLSTLRESAALTMQRLKTREAIRLGALQTVTRDFFLFRLA